MSSIERQLDLVGPENDWSYSPYGAVPVRAKKLRNAEVVWINKRWFASQGISVLDGVVVERLKQELLDDFAFIVPRLEDPSDAFEDRWKIFYADRYGEAGMVAHGGSGRAGSWKRIQVKGIGVTSLIGTNANWLHSHGCVWMEEAIREVIYSELFDAEYPAGAVPIIAVIDTFLHAEMPRGFLGERRALLLRPTVPRVAHLLRATFYRSYTHVRQEQIEDAKRVGDAVRWYKHLCEVPETVFQPAKLCSVVAQGIAFNEIFRLTTGGVTASALTLRGQLIDFGGARALPNWFAAELTAGSPAFGADSARWSGILSDLCYHQKKHGFNVDLSSLSHLFRLEYQAWFRFYILRFWGVGRGHLSARDQNELIGATLEIFLAQQRKYVSYVTGEGGGFLEWIHNDLLKLHEGGGREVYFGGS